MKRTMMIAMLSACVLALGACGDDGGEGGSNTGGSGGSTGGSSGESGMGSGGSDTGGSGGSTGGSGGSTGGSGGSTGGTGGMPAGPVTCGGTECPMPMSTRLVACCTEEDVCGERVAGFGRICAAPVEPHPDCESAMITLGSSMFTVSSCCTAEGACGLTAPLLQLDCTSNEELIEMTMPDGGTGDGGTSDGGMGNNPFGIDLTPPDPATCTP